MNQKVNYSKKKSDKRTDRENNENHRKDSTEERNSREKLNNYLPSHDLSKNAINYEETNTRNYDLNNNENETQVHPKRKKRVENNDRSLDNIISHNIYANALGINNIKVLKSENFENSNNSIIRDRSPYDDSSSVKRKNKENVNIMMLPNIKNQINYENK